MCADYERAIADAGGVDLQLLGVGSDGHVAFNEPGSSLSSRTRIKTLTARTRADNERFFEPPDEVPHHVLTQGLGTILEARHLVLIARGAGKAPAVQQLVEGPVSAFCPASVLQLHPHATVLLDDDAASQLRLGRLLPGDVRRQARVAGPVGTCAGAATRGLAGGRHCALGRPLVPISGIRPLPQGCVSGRCSRFRQPTAASTDAYN